MNFPAVRALRSLMIVMTLYVTGAAAVADPGGASSTVWQPGEAQHQRVLLDGPGEVQGMILTRHLSGVLEDLERLTQQPLTDWDELLEFEALYFAPTDGDGYAMAYERLPFPDAEPEADTVGIWLGGWEEESRLTISASDIREVHQSFSFALKPAVPASGLTLDAIREKAYLGTLHLIVQEYASMTGRMPRDFEEALEALKISHEIESYSSDRVAQITVDINRSIPALKTRIVYPGGDAVDRLEVYTIDRKAGVVTTKVHVGAAAQSHAAFSGVYEPFVAVEFPLIDPAPEPSGQG